MLKKILKYIAYTIIALLLALVLLPFVFENELKEAFKEQVNESIHGEFDFADLNLSFVKSFPNARIELIDCFIKSSYDKEGDTLAKLGQFILDVDLVDVFQRNNDLSIQYVSLANADVDIYETAELSNYQIIKNTEKSETPLTYQIELQEYDVKNLNIKYLNQENKIVSSVSGLNHKGQGDFSQSHFNLKTITDIANLSVQRDGQNYVDHKPIKLNADIQIDQENSKFTVNDGKCLIDLLQLNFDGSIQNMSEGIAVEIGASSLDQDFKNYLSIIPGVFKDNLNNIEASGNGKFDIYIQGLFSENSVPAFNLDFVARDGKISSSKLKDNIDNINIELRAQSAKNDMSDLNLKIPVLNFDIADQSFQSSFNSSNVQSNPRFVGQAKGKMNLEYLNTFISIDNIEALEGIADIDFNFDGTRDQIVDQSYEDIDLSGHVKMTDILMKSNDKTELKLRSALLDLNEETTIIDLDELELGNSKLDVNGHLNNVLSYLVPDQQITGEIKVLGSELDLNEWISDSSGDTGDSYFRKDRIELIVTADIESIKYLDYDINSLKTVAIVQENNVQINEAKASVNGSPLIANGYFANTLGFALAGDTLLSELYVSFSKFNLSQFLKTDKSSNSTLIPRIPPNINMIIHAIADNFNYDEYVLSNAKSEISIHDGIAILNNTTAQGFDGEVSFTGVYDSNHEKPRFNMSYDLKSLNFSKLYQSSKLFSSLAPIAQYVSGYFNSDLKMSGVIGEDLRPELNNISADGFIETLNSQITGFPPLQSLANSLGIQSLKDFAIKNTKNWLQIENGFVILKPTDYKVEEINMTISGKHSISQDLDYAIKMEIPREMFKQNQSLEFIDDGLDQLSKKASSLGIDIFSGDFIYATAKITGTVLKPIISVKPTGSGGENLSKQAEDALSNRADELKNELEDKANDKIEETKDALSDMIDEKINEAETKVDSVVSEVTDDITNQAEQVIKEQIDSRLNDIIPDTLKESISDKLNDILKDDSSKTDKLKEQLDKLNPFKKKKKKN